MHRVKLASITCELPTRKLANDDPVFRNLPEMSNRWWRFWGIEKRGHYCPERGENEFSAARTAISRLLLNTDTDPKDVELLVCSASSPILTDSGGTLPNTGPRLYPRLSRALKDSLNMKNALAWDSQMECASFLLNMKLASCFIQQGKIKTAVIVCSEYVSNILDPTARSSTIFSDGCAATLLTRSDDQSDLLGSAQHSNADHYEIATGKWRFPERKGVDDRVKLYFTLQEEGQSKMQEFVPENVPIAVNNALKSAGMESSQVDHFVFHQPSPLLVHAWASSVGCPEHKYLQTMKDNGVMVSVSIPYTLHTALRTGKIPNDGVVVLAGASTGWGFAAQVWRMGNVVAC